MTASTDDPFARFHRLERPWAFYPYSGLALWSPPRPPSPTYQDLSIRDVDGGVRIRTYVSLDKRRGADESWPARCEGMADVVTANLGVAAGRATDLLLDNVAARVLILPRSPRWREALSTALVGSWCVPLWVDGFLPVTALSSLRAEARAVHRQLVPIWRRRTRHGRVLSLDADLGGLSLYDLVAADVGLLAHTAGGVFEDDRLNRVLRALNPAERAVVFAYAEGEGTTWTEAATVAGVTDPAAFGERVRRKAKRIAAEQARRTALTSR
ncbi:hypothetical protein [Streptomyces chartreusis]|uniref:hypothetical protein n=1 Tax=Streptomyces chartreusis TaxID=1969 RepID=UPI0036B51FA2